MNIKQAKQINLDDFLQRLGLKPVRQTPSQAWYLSPLRNEDTPSFKVNRERNQWYDFGEGTGGDILTLMKAMEKLNTISDALARIESIMGGARPEPIVRQPNLKPVEPAAIEPIQIKRITSRWLFAYLRNRGIIPKLALPYVKQAHYTHDGKELVALAFANDHMGYELRSPKCKRTFGRKDITTIKGQPYLVQVFEGYFDFLTSLMQPECNRNATSIVLNSVAMREKAAATIANIKPNWVHVYRDRDRAGEDLFNFLTNALPGIEVIDMSKLYEGYKDLNEWHVATREEPAPVVVEKA